MLVSRRNEAIDEYKNFEKTSYFLEKPYFEAINEVGTMFEKNTITEIKYNSPTEVEVYITENGKFLEDIAKNCKVEVDKNLNQKWDIFQKILEKMLKIKKKLEKYMKNIEI